MSEQLSDHAWQTTLLVSRVMYPHDALPDEAYEKVVRQIEADARGNADIQETVEQGIAQLDGETRFRDLAPEAQLEALRRIEGSAFFDLVQATAVVELYDNPLVWKAFGSTTSRCASTRGGRARRCMTPSARSGRSARRRTPRRTTSEPRG